MTRFMNDASADEVISGRGGSVGIVPLARRALLRWLLGLVRLQEETLLARLTAAFLRDGSFDGVQESER